MTDARTPKKRERGRPAGRAYPHSVPLRLDDASLAALQAIQVAHGNVDRCSAVRIALAWYSEDLEKKKTG